MINEQLFFKWADKKIGQPIVKGDQIRFNSPFCEDSKHHLYCNIKKFWKGVFNCSRPCNEIRRMSVRKSNANPWNRW